MMRDTNTTKRIVVGITGASGALYALRVLHLLVANNVEVHLSVTKLGRRLLVDELGLASLDPDRLTEGHPDLLTIHKDADLGAGIASGSFMHDGMLIVPCSSNTLNSVAAGITDTLVQRAAACCLKERRPLVLAHRESPLSPIDVRSYDTLTRAGAVIAPLSPGFYLLPKSIDEIVDFMAAKLLDLVGIEHDVQMRWDKHLEASQ